MFLTYKSRKHQDPMWVHRHFTKEEIELSTVNWKKKVTSLLCKDTQVKVSCHSVCMVRFKSRDCLELVTLGAVSSADRGVGDTPSGV